MPLLLINDASPVLPPAKKIRIARSFAFKSDVIRAYEACLANPALKVKLVTVAEMFNISPSMVLRYYKEKDKIKIKGKSRKTRNSTKGHAGKGRKTIYKDCDAILLSEFKEKRDQGNRIGPQWLKSRMKQLLAEKDPASFQRFKASGPWLYRWTKRNRISVRKSTNRKQTNLLERMPTIEKWLRTLHAFISNQELIPSPSP
jgi:hypothetical protein